MLILHTVVHQTKAINKLKSQGIIIPDKVLENFSPYWTEHINRFGTFLLDTKRVTTEMDYHLI